MEDIRELLDFRNESINRIKIKYFQASGHLNFNVQKNRQGFMVLHKESGHFSSSIKTEKS